MKAIPRAAYTVAEVAEALGMSRQSVTALIHGGKLAAFRCGKNDSGIRVHAASLTEYLAGAPDARDEPDAA